MEVAVFPVDSHRHAVKVVVLSHTIRVVSVIRSKNSGPCTRSGRGYLILQRCIRVPNFVLNGSRCFSRGFPSACGQSCCPESYYSCGIGYTVKKLWAVHSVGSRVPHTTAVHTCTQFCIEWKSLFFPWIPIGMRSKLLSGVILFVWYRLYGQKTLGR